MVKPSSSQSSAQTKPATPAQAEPENKADRRQHRRVNLPLQARFLTDAGEESKGIVVNISAGGAMLRTSSPPAFGANVVVYIDQIGRIQGQVVRSGKDNFAVCYQQNPKKQAKIADNLTSAVNNKNNGSARRANPRISSENSLATVFLEDGRSLRCSILDISLTGASIEINPRPPLGTPLIVGRMTAKVVRRHDQGVGVVFTGAADRMDKVLEDSADVDPFDTTGAGIAHTFGKKGTRF